MSASQTRIAPAALAALACTLVSPAVMAQADASANWSITPYLWASDTGLDLTFRDTGVGSGELSFGDLLDILDAALMVHVEGGSGNWSGFGDLTYLKMSDTAERTVFTIDSNNEQLFFDAAVAYWPGGFGSNFNVFGGLRFSSFDDRFDFRLTANDAPVATRSSKKDYYDALLGLRYRFDLSERWSLLTHGDVSFGDSEGTYLLRANFAYAVGQRRLNRIMFGYQYKQAEFRDADLTTDWTYAGPMAGFNFRF